MRTSRRDLLIGATASTLCPRVALAQASDAPPVFTTAEINDMLADEAEPVAGVKAVISAFWYELPANQRPQPGWPDDKESFDYQHLTSEALPAGSFRVSAATIENYLKVCNFAQSSAPLLLFGLRGAALTSSSGWSPPAQQQLITEDRPDHIHPRCLIGVLDRRTGTIALASASTVPVVDLMHAAAAGKCGCNMLPTGYHQYRVGPHKKLRQPAAFRQQNPLWVHRAKGRLIYSFADADNVWDDGNGTLPMDDIHAAMLSYNSKPPFFSSAGCQVVVGAYRRNTHQPYGPWAEFRKAAGLVSPIHILSQAGRSSDDGKGFDYLLLTGKEAGLVAAGRIDAVRSIRFGASGAAVRSLQGALNVHQTGVFDRRTMGALISWQSAHSYPPSGILTPAQATALHVAI